MKNASPNLLVLAILPLLVMGGAATASTSQNGHLSAGDHNTCHIKRATGMPDAEDGQLWCWGHNDQGQQGNGTVEPYVWHQPTQVGTKHDWSMVAVGAAHVCAVDDAHDLFCWGRNQEGQLGIGNSDDSMEPKYVMSMVDRVVAGQLHTCATTFDDEFPSPGRNLYCWGKNTFGAVGDGTNEQRDLPTKVMSSDDFDDIRPAAGALGTCAVVVPAGGNPTAVQAQLYCWGPNDEGRLGLGFVSPSENVPRLVTQNVENPGAVFTGLKHTCFEDGANNPTGALPSSVKCMGRSGSLGIGSAPPSVSTVPVNVGLLTGGVLLEGVDAINSCAVDGTSRRVCWGNDEYGQLGQGSPSGHAYFPIAVPGMDASGLDAGAGAVGVRHACAPTSDVTVTGTFPNSTTHVVTTLYCWGKNDEGQIGTGSNTPEKIAVPTPVMQYEYSY